MSLQSCLTWPSVAFRLGIALVGAPSRTHRNRPCAQAPGISSIGQAESCSRTSSFASATATSILGQRQRRRSHTGQGAPRRAALLHRRGAPSRMKSRGQSGRSGVRRAAHGPIRSDVTPPRRQSRRRVADRCRIFLTSAYSDELSHARAAAPSSNSTTTSRSGDQLPSITSTLPPRTMYRPPWASTVAPIRSRNSENVPSSVISSLTITYAAMGFPPDCRD